MNTPIASIKTVNHILREHDLHAKKFLGQNFIVDRKVIDKIIRVSTIDPTKHVLEIGPGIGSLTEALCEHASSVTAVEIDAHMVNILKETCGHFPNLTVIHDDFLDVDVDQLCQQPMIVCANLPYYVTTPILFALFESGCDFEKIIVMVQKEVAERLKAVKGFKQYNALSILVQTCYEVKVEFDVSKHVFIPKPAVDSSVISFIKRKDVDMMRLQPLFDFIKKCFAFRRKTLANNLKEIVDPHIDVSECLQKAQLKADVRAQNCSYEDFKRLYEVIYET